MEPSIVFFHKSGLFAKLLLGEHGLPKSIDFTNRLSEASIFGNRRDFERLAMPKGVDSSDFFTFFVRKNHKNRIEVYGVIND